MRAESKKQDSEPLAAALPLAPEAPVSLIVDGKPIAVLMCSPYDLDELAVGHLLSRGLIEERADLSALSICPDMKSVRVETLSGAGASADPEGLVYSACGAARIEPPHSPDGTTRALPGPDSTGEESEGRPGLEEIAEWARAMFSAAELYRKTGGLHVAALASPRKNEIPFQNQPNPLRPRDFGDKYRPTSLPYFVVREDVGRHNAVDKVLGRGFLDKVDFAGTILLTSGRIAADMVQKAVRAGVPILVSRSIPTTEAYSIAAEAGVTLIGRIGTGKPILYTRPDRIRLGEPIHAAPADRPGEPKPPRGTA